MPLGRRGLSPDPRILPPFQLRRPGPTTKPVVIPAPEHFSFIENTEELVRFFGRIEKVLKRGETPRLDLSQITSIGAEACMVLTAITHDLVHVYRAQVLGIRPSDPAIENILAQSGFYEYVQVAHGTKPTPEHGFMYERVSRTVESKTARELIRLATREVYGTPQRKQMTFRSLVECMQNTFQHAGRNVKREDWWSAVYCDPGTGTARFSFVDNGIGIFKSVQLRKIQRLRRALGLPSNPGLLREIMEGKIGSRTGLSYRGKGLPELYRLAKAGILRNLTIITNDVRARVAEDSFERIDADFSGTFYYWELGE
ncbi:MAG: hypothetical protein ABI837_15940 [Acidobacteriota bacterium]